MRNDKCVSGPDPHFGTSHTSASSPLGRSSLGTGPCPGCCAIVTMTAPAGSDDGAPSTVAEAGCDKCGCRFQGICRGEYDAPRSLFSRRTGLTPCPLTAAAFAAYQGQCSRARQLTFLQVRPVSPVLLFLVTPRSRAPSANLALMLKTPWSYRSGPKSDGTALTHLSTFTGLSRCQKADAGSGFD